MHILKAERPPDLPPGEVPDEPFRLQLLSTDMYHKSMRERLAAGAATQLERPPGGGAAATQQVGSEGPVKGDAWLLGGVDKYRA